ncbi:MAG: class I SAM-dependent methyltransferase [Synergistaceae bacterium]|jgi:hypothetical protein|nr:class I SAM-dependent methyltransferase [Synergistaceae bacterium]
MNEKVYSTVKKASMADYAVYKARLRIYGALSGKIPLQNISNVLDVGVTADEENISSNFFENLYPHPDRITALSDQDASWMENKFNGLKFVKGDALNMPFENNSFDLVFSSAVIEHVGNIAHQTDFVKECYRVSKKYVFITTPNRFYPIELHTALPFIHWLPKHIHRAILRRLGHDYLSREENLNLMTKGEIKKICAQNIGGKYEIMTVNFLGLPSNILLLLVKP